MTPDELVEIEAIKRLKYAYSRCLDTKAWDELATLARCRASGSPRRGGPPAAAAIWPADPPELVVKSLAMSGKARQVHGGRSDQAPT